MTEPTGSNGNGNSALSGADMLALLTRIDAMLGKMEGRIMDRLSENSTGAATRWTAHEKHHTEELAENTRRVVVRFEKVEKALDDHIAQTNKIFDRLHDDRVANDARVKPVKTVAGFIVANWKSIMLAILALAGVLGWVGLETHIAGQ